MERARSYTTQQCRSIQLYAAAGIQMNLDFSQCFNWVRKRAVFNALKVSRIFQCKKTLTEWSFLESRAEYLKDLNYFAFSNTQSKYKMKWTKILQRLQGKRSQHNYSASCRFNSLLFFSSILVKSWQPLKEAFSPIQSKRSWSIFYPFMRLA